MQRELKNWTVTGYWPYSTVLKNSAETGIELIGVTRHMTSEKTGDIYNILRKNGEIDEDIYFGKNTVKYEWVANRWWVFAAEFSAAKADPSNRLRLVIEGIDYEADIHINGKFICSHKGPFIPLVIDLDDFGVSGDKNRLEITLHCTPQEYAQMGYTSKTSTQRSRFDLNWDFCTRMAGIGIYGPVYIEETGCGIIDNGFVKPYLTADGVWTVPGEFSVNSDRECSGSVKCELFYKGDFIKSSEKEISLKKGENQVSAPLTADEVNKWYPNGHGGQPLYTLKISLSADGRLSHCKEYTVAFRTLEYARAQNSSADSLPYVPVINGEKIYIKGVNLVPFDLAAKFPSDDIYGRALELLKDANINLVRIWGGGILESEYFYSLCDKYGIMVWQEFIQSSSGIDNSPCTDPEFLKLLEKTSASMIKQRRNHTSLTFYCGGNELYLRDTPSSEEYPVDYSHPNISMLKGLTDSLDPGVLMLPSSPSGPNMGFKEDKPGTNHDIHGPWLYFGPNVHYEFFNKSDIILHGEFGCNGMSGMETLKSCLPQDSLRVSAAFSDPMWNWHGGDWWDTTQRDSAIFGEFKEDELETLIKCSQFIQAEGIRYALQSNLRRAMQNCGSIIWQFNEPWPNISCTSLTSYPLIPKLAYYFTKDSYAGEYVSLKYSKLCWQAGETFNAEVFAFCEKGVKEGTVLCEISDTGGNILFKKEWQARASMAVSLGEIKFEIPKDLKEGFTVTVCWQEENSLKNEYLMLIPEISDGKCSKKAVTDYVDRYFENIR